MALGELLAVGAEDARDVRVPRRLVPERPQDLNLLRGVRDVVVPTDHVRDRVVHVLHGRGEVVRRPAVRADDDDVLELLVRELDAPAHRVLPARDPVVGHPEADRALVLVRRSLRDEPSGELAAAIHRVELEGHRPVPVDAEPGQRALDLLRGLLHLAARVGVLDPQQARARATARKEPVEEERVDAADMEKPGRGRGHADADAHRAPMLDAAQAGLGATERPDLRIAQTDGSSRIAAHEVHITMSASQSVSTMPTASESGPTSAIPIGIRTKEPSVS